MQFLSPTNAVGILLAVTLAILVFHLARRRAWSSYPSLTAAAAPALSVSRKTLWLLSGIVMAGLLFVVVTDLWPHLWPGGQPQFISLAAPDSIAPVGGRGDDAVASPIPPPPDSGSTAGPPNASALQAIRGVVRGFSYGPGGEIDGLTLDQGFVVHFPADQAGRLAPIVQVGSPVSIRALVHVGPAGDRVADTETILNQQTGASVTLGPPRGPLPPGR